MNIKKLFITIGLLPMLVVSFFTVSVSAETFFDDTDDVAVTSLPYDTLQSDGSLLYDDADILTDSEEAKLESMLDDVSAAHKMDVAVVTVYSLGSKTAQEFADDYYDYNGYGQGSSKDGVVLMLSMENRKWHLSTTGAAINAVSDDSLDYIFSSDNVLSYFKNDDWTGGFECYADMMDDCFTAYENGDSYPPAEPIDYLIFFAVSLGVGVLSAVIFVFIICSQHKSVRKKAGASDYYINNSLAVTQSYDAFLYRNVARTPKSNDSSSTHTSSSGTSHGGGGGSF